MRVRANLYPKALFDIISARIPIDWVRDEFEEGDYYCDPPECRKPGFHEDWHDGDPTARAVFRAVRDRLEREEP